MNNDNQKSKKYLSYIIRILLLAIAFNMPLIHSTIGAYTVFAEDVLFVDNTEDFHALITEASSNIESKISIVLSEDYNMKDAIQDLRNWPFNVPYISEFLYEYTDTQIDIYFKYYTAGNVYKKYVLNEDIKLNAKEKELYNVAMTIVNKCKSKSQYQKSLIIHDEICKKATYLESSNDQDVYNLLVKGKGVCNAYADAFHLLSSLAGLQSIKVLGEATGFGEHAWNQVKIGGSWYEVDVTWDDQKNTYSHEYFNITTAQMKQDHTYANTLYNKCTATKYNYYKQTKKAGQKYVSNYTALVSYLKQEVKNKSKQLNYEIFVAKGYAKNINLNTLLNARKANTISTSTSAGNKNWYVLKIKFKK